MRESLASRPLKPPVTGCRLLTRRLCGFCTGVGEWRRERLLFLPKGGFITHQVNSKSCGLQRTCALLALLQSCESHPVKKPRGWQGGLGNKKALVTSLTARALSLIPEDPVWRKKRGNVHMYAVVHMYTCTCGYT